MRMCFGNKMKMTVKGASHDKEMTVRISGFPAGLKVDTDALNAFLERRKPENVIGATTRREDDTPVFFGGIKDGVTDGSDILAKVYNKDFDDSVYLKYDDMPRPSHADYVSHEKYGKALAGGGIFSGRMTLPYCIAGGLAVQYLETVGVRIDSYILRIGNAERKGYDYLNPEDFSYLTDNMSDDMKFEIGAAAGRNDSVGGVIEGIVHGLPVGVGEPIFGGLEARLASVLYSIPAVKGVEFGKGFSFSEMCGSVANDSFIFQNGVVKTQSNNNGGINGGLSNGMPVILKVAVKPTPSIGIVQKTVSLKQGVEVSLEIKGRHDTCIVPRAAVVVEACMAFVVLDLMLEGGFTVPENTIESLRGDMDVIDDAIGEALAARHDIAKKIGAYKKVNKLAQTDTLREEEIVNRLAEKYNLSADDVRDVYNVLFKLSKKTQNE